MAPLNHERSKLVEAARAAALALPKNHAGKTSIFSLIQAFEETTRKHDTCELSRPLARILKSTTASCQCPSHLEGIDFCYAHGAERLDDLRRRQSKLYQEAAIHDDECKAIEHSLSRARVTITRVAPGASVSDSPARKQKHATQVDFEKWASMLGQP